MLWQYVVMVLLALILKNHAFRLTCDRHKQNCELVDVKKNENNAIKFPATSSRDLAQQVIGIDIKWSNFPNFPGNLFEVMPNLQNITARNSRIVSLSAFGPDSSFNVDGIRMLRLEGNDLNTLKGYTFGRTKRMTELLLARNRVSNVDAHAFHGLSELRVLDLSLNQLTHLDLEVFAPLRSLQTIYLLDNQLQVVNLDVFRHNPELMYINLMNNDMATLQSTHVNNVTRHIDLRSNELVDISALGKMKRLDILQLSDNKKVDLSPRTFTEMGQLIQLRLNGVDMQRRQNNDFRFLTPLECLRVLFIGRNDLTSLSSLPNLPMLYGLLANDNEISMLDVNYLKAQNPKLMEINIKNNRWNCQVLKNVVNQLKNSRIKLTFNNGEDWEQPAVNVANVEGVGCDDKPLLKQH